jgi:hypothetical protein
MQTTMPERIREVEDAAKRNYQIMALLEAGGRISTNHSGEGIRWPVKYKFHKAQAATGENTRNFTPTNLWKHAILDYRGYEVTDSVKRRELEKNKGDEAIIRLSDGFADRLQESLIEELGPQFYVDGEAADNELFWHGFRTLSQTNAQTFNVNSPFAARAANAADRVAVPSGTYAGLNMAPGTYGGSQDTSAVWPEATASSQYDFWSAINVVSDSTSFGDGSNPGLDWERALRYGITHAQRNSTLEGQTTNVWMDRSEFIDLKNNNDGRQTIEVKMGTSLLELGFRNVFIFDGVEISWETAVPVGYAFGLSLECLELLVLTANLFEVEGPEYDMHTQSMNCVVSTLSNLKYKSPRNFCIWKPLTAV